MSTQVLVTAEESMKEAKWIGDAACSVEDSALFFSEYVRDITAAKQICLRCPQMATCLEGALRRSEPGGVWGGQLFVNGSVVMSKRGRGRPRKVGSADDDIASVPVPAHLVPLLRTA